jgi:hypothetical protein
LTTPLPRRIRYVSSMPLSTVWASMPSAFDARNPQLLAVLRSLLETYSRFTSPVT